MRGFESLILCQKRRDTTWCLFFFASGRDSNPLQCKAPVEPCHSAAGRRVLLTICPSKGKSAIESLILCQFPYIFPFRDIFRNIPLTRSSKSATLMLEDLLGYFFSSALSVIECTEPGKSSPIFSTVSARGTACKIPATWIDSFDTDSFRPGVFGR